MLFHVTDLRVRAGVVLGRFYTLCIEKVRIQPFVPALQTLVPGADAGTNGKNGLALRAKYYCLPFSTCRIMLVVLSPAPPRTGGIRLK